MPRKRPKPPASPKLDRRAYDGRMKSKAKDDLSQKVARCVRAMELGRKNYRQADVTMDALEKEMTPGDVVIVSSGKLRGKKFKMIDKFAGGKTRINVGMNARRYELEEVLDP